MKTELTLTQLAAIGAKACHHADGRGLVGDLVVNPERNAYASDRPFREAFAKAVRDAVLNHIAESGKRVAPDPYAELRAACAAGKAIEVFIADDEYGPDRWSLKENNSWSLPPERYRIKPEPVIVPLDYDDIRATDEFKSKGGGSICTLLSWDATTVRTSMYTLTYDRLASICLRRQHGSNEWKPCTKEITK
jgi:hypothetical protein